jgi:hypothetical protein
MKTTTLHNLIKSFEDEQAYVEVAAQFETKPERRHWFEQRAGMTGMIMARIRGEIEARGAPGTRRAADAQRFDGYLERMLEDYPDVSSSGLTPMHVCARTAF